MSHFYWVRNQTHLYIFSRSRGEKKELPLSVVIVPPLPHDQLISKTFSQEGTVDVVPVLSGCVLPYVMLWNPIMQLLPSHTRGIGLGCSVEHCVGSLVLKCWKVGQTHSLQPRILHTVEHTVLLVSALYSCSFGHEISSTDPNFLMQISQDHIPFVLLHKTGFLKQFIQSVLSLVRQGMTFSSVERFITDRREHFAN